MNTLKWWEKLFIALAGLGAIATPIVIGLAPAAGPALQTGNSELQRIVNAIPPSCESLGIGAACNAFSAPDVYEVRPDGGAPCRCPPVAR